MYTQQYSTQVSKETLVDSRERWSQYNKIIFSLMDRSFKQNINKQ